MRILIQDGDVLTLGAKSPNLAGADVLVEDGRVAEVGRGLRARDAEVVDATGAVVMPGFVDAHRRAWTSLLRTLGTRGTPEGAPPVPGDFGPHHEPDDVYAATLLGLLGAVESGITTVVDFADIALDDRYVDASLQAHADAGLRTVLVPVVPEWAGGVEDGGDVLDPARRLLERRGDTSPTELTRVAFGHPAGSLIDVATVGEAWSAARERGLHIHVRTGLTEADAGTVAELASHQLLGADVTIVHGSRLADPDLDAIAAAGAGFVTTPAAEMAAGAMPPMQRLIDRHIRPGLGVGDELAAPGDVFAQMRAAQSVQHASSFQRKLAGKAGVPALLGTRDVIRYATVDGARAVGQADVAGSIEAGKPADIVVLRTDTPNIAPVNDPIGAVVWGMDTTNVSWVLVGGRVRVRDGELDADTARVRSLAETAADRVMRASGHLVTVGGPP